MECRRTLWVFLGLLGAVGGCQHAGPLALTAAQPPAGTPVMTIPEGAVIQKEGDLPKRPPKAATCVAFADFRADEARAAGVEPLEKQRHREMARKAYQQALEIDPHSLSAYRGLARLYTDLGDHAHAIETYRRGLKVLPGEGGLWCELGMCHARGKEWQQALECLGKAVEREPENRQYANALGYTLARVGRYDDSLACFTRVHGAAQAHYNLARMLRHLGEAGLARQHLDLAVRQDPQLADARSLLDEMNGQPAQAVQTVDHREPAPPGEPPAP